MDSRASMMNKGNLLLNILLSIAGVVYNLIFLKDNYLMFKSQEIHRDYLPSDFYKESAKVMFLAGSVAAFLFLFGGITAAFLYKRRYNYVVQLLITALLASLFASLIIFADLVLI